MLGGRTRSRDIIWIRQDTELLNLVLLVPYFHKKLPYVCFIYVVSERRVLEKISPTMVVMI